MTAGTWGAARIRLNLVDLVNQSTALDLAATGGAIGSWGLQNGVPGTSATRAWLKTGSTTSAWTNQNFNLQVFNVKDFGAVGDGVTNDTTAINAAISAARTAGGGLIYFPIGTYACFRPGPAPIRACFDLNGDVDMFFLGDGSASRLRMTGDSLASDWHLFRIHNNSRRIRFYHLGMDGVGIINPDPAEQNHIIQIRGIAGEPGAPSDIDIRGCWFGETVGDGVQILGETANTVTNIRVIENAFDQPNTRSCVAVQRATGRTIVHDNWLTGPTDQCIDFEPTGLAVEFEYSILRNIVLGNGTTVNVTLTGESITFPHSRSVFGSNILAEGVVNALSIVNLDIIANVVTSVQNSTFPAFDFTRNIDFCLIAANVLYRETTTLQCPLLAITGNVESVAGPDLVSDNLFLGTFSDQSFSSTSQTAVQVDGCCAFMNPAANNTAVAFQTNGAIVSTDRAAFTGCMAVSLSGNAMLHGFRTTVPTGFVVRNVLLKDSYCRNTFSGIRFSRSGTGSYTDAQGAIDNMFISNNDSIEVVSNLIGVTLQGTAGPGTQIVRYDLAAGPSGVVSAPVGSLATITTGAAGTVLYRKETGTGNTGWINVGGFPVEFGTKNTNAAVSTALFPAPGFDQTIAGTAEVAITLPRPCTIRNLRLSCTAGVGAGNTVYTVRRNAANTTLVLTVLHTAATGATTANPQAFAAGDQLSISITKSALPATAQTNVVLVLEMI